jgi:hypothetical protein
MIAEGWRTEGMKGSGLATGVDASGPYTIIGSFGLTGNFGIGSVTTKDRDKLIDIAIAHEGMHGPDLDIDDIKSISVDGEWNLENHLRSCRLGLA